jgi:hypothetical protein
MVFVVFALLALAYISIVTKKNWHSKFVFGMIIGNLFNFVNVNVDYSKYIRFQL